MGVDDNSCENILTGDGDAHSSGSLPATHYQFVEVFCTGEGKIRRFAAGTNAGFALERINRKLAENVSSASCIEAVKDGEEPVEFGPLAELVVYGPGWTLQTLHDHDVGCRSMEKNLYRNRPEQRFLKSYQTSEAMKRSSPKLSVLYFAKIAFSFCFVFFLAGVFTLILQNLPHFLLYLKAYK